jgi:hypothetical protein
MTFKEQQQANRAAAADQALKHRADHAKREMRAMANLICEECAAPLRNKRAERQVVRFCSKGCRSKRDTGKEIENYG